MSSGEESMISNRRSNVNKVDVVDDDTPLSLFSPDEM
jgi:hypothetical protein